MEDPRRVARTDLKALLRDLQPTLDPVPYAFCSVAKPNPSDLAGALAMINEAEAVSLVVSLEDDRYRNVQRSGAMAKITLQVNSALEAVGLTAAVSTTLADAHIPCNIVAGYHHDHVFVPWELRQRALELLQQLSRGQD